jgi:hypothetical protein
MLNKMENDNWSNAVKLITGEWFVADHCVVSGKWVKFTEILECHGFPDYVADSWGFERGIEVQIDNIAWIVEQGS